MNRANIMSRQVLTRLSSRQEALLSNLKRDVTWKLHVLFLKQNSAFHFVQLSLLLQNLTVYF